MQNSSALSEYTLPELGNVKSTLSYRSVPGLFSIDLPQCVARKTTEISLTASVPSLSEKSLHCSLNLDDKFSSSCKVAQVDSERFTVMLSPEQPGLHILSVRIGEHEGNMHRILFEVPVISITDWRGSRLEVFADGLRHPHGVAVTDDGKFVIVTESQRNCVTVFFAENGEVVKRFGKHGNHPGEFENPKEVAVSTESDGYIYVMDNNQFQEFTLFGLHKSSLSKSSGQIGYGLAFLSHDEGLLTCSTREMVFHKVNPALNKFEPFGNIPSGEPYDIAVDTKGLIYVLTSSKGIHKFTPDGEHISSFGSKGTQPHQFKLPREL